MKKFLAIDSLYISIAHISHIELQGTYLDKDGVSHEAVWVWLRGKEENGRSPDEGLLWLDSEAVALREPLQRWLIGQSCHVFLKPPDTPLDWLTDEAQFQQWLTEITADTEQESA